MNVNTLVMEEILVMSEPFYIKFQEDVEEEGRINLDLMAIRDGKEIPVDELSNEAPNLSGIYAITVLTLLSTDDTIKKYVNEKLAEIIKALSNSGEKTNESGD